MSLSLITIKNGFLCCVPILALASSAVIFSVALHCSNQTHRWYLFPFFIASAICSFNTSEYFDRFSHRLFHIWCMGLLFYVFHIISLLYIERWPAPKKQFFDTSQKDETATLGQRYFRRLDIQATYKLWGNPRLLFVISKPVSDQNQHTDTEIQEVIPYSVFYFLRLIKLPIYYALYSHILPFIFSETVIDWFPDDVSPMREAMIRRLNDVDSREILVRGYISIWWVLESVVFLDSPNALLACFFVATGLDKPCDWPPLFGTITSATSIRRFWSKFWHTLAVRPYTNYAKLIAYNVLGLKPGSFFFKTVVACIIFSLSGVLHAAVDWRTGQPTWYVNIGWFFLNFLACLAETLILSAIRSVAGSMNYSRELNIVEKSWFGKFVGYTWVFAFFFCSTPKWIFPAIYCQFSNPLMDDMTRGKLFIEALLNG